MIPSPSFIERTTPRPLHEPDPPALARIAFVLVNPSHPGNVGAAARAMKTMGLADLRLVAPRFADVCDRPDAQAFASGAGDVLGAARSFGSLADAIADTALSVAVSAEPREFGPLPAPPEACAAQAFAVLAASPAHRVAFVFGAERTGLSIESVQACGVLASIPASPVYSSLNLAQALQIVAYCVRRAALDDALRAAAADAAETSRPAGPDTGEPVPEDERRTPLADQRALQGFLEHLERSLLAIGFLDPAHPKKLMARMRRLFLRARLRTEEVDLLRGICNLMERGPRR
jgi:tRNA/rRNA methyltransferase